jgi:hypothetical protein
MCCACCGGVYVLLLLLWPCCTWLQWPGVCSKGLDWCVMCAVLCGITWHTGGVCLYWMIVESR